MRWFRSHLHFGSRLALFALAVQIALSFGHVHLQDLAQPTAQQSAGLTAPSADVPGAPAAPSKKSHGAIDDFCAVCQLIQLAATSVPATAPSLVLPVASGDIRLGHKTEFDLAASSPLVFQARAPPLA